MVKPKLFRMKNPVGDLTHAVMDKTGFIFKSLTQKEAEYLYKKERQGYNRKLREEALASLGLVKVRGALGGVYYE